MLCLVVIVTEATVIFNYEYTLLYYVSCLLKTDPNVIDCGTTSYFYIDHLYIHYHVPCLCSTCLLLYDLQLETFRLHAACTLTY